MLSVLPNFRPDGLLPTVDATDPEAHAGRSPHWCTCEALVMRCATTPRRRDLMRALLDYRQEARALGLTNGIQWVDGSFVESRDADPNDVDVLTIAQLPKVDARQLRAIHANLTSTQRRKDAGVHAHLLPHDDRMRIFTRSVAYWAGLFGHTKSGSWKGFVELALDPHDDEKARAALGNV